VAETKSPISLVELHRHDRDKPIFFQSGRILAFQWTSSVTPPHGNATVTLAVPVSSFDVAMPGDWIIIRNMRGAAVFFGYVTNVTDGISIGNNNAVVSNPLVVQAETWLDMLSRVELYSPPANSYDRSVGTFFSVYDYASLVESYLGDFAFGNLGEAVRTIFKRIALVKFPKSLAGGGLLSEHIPVVFDYGTGRTHAPDLMVEEIPTAGAFPTHIGYQSVRSNVYPMLRTLFVPEPALIEMFPHLSHLRDPNKPLATVLQVRDDGEIYDSTGLLVADTGVDDTVVDVDLSPSNPNYRAGGLAEYLKARPSLVYRVKPWRNRPLRQSVFAAVGSGSYKSTERLVDGENPDDIAASDLGQREILADMFDEITWDPALFARVPQGRVVSLERTRSDQNRLNCTFIHLGVTDVNVLQASGLPILIDSEVERHGLRTASPTWPFIITPDEVGKQKDFILYMRSIAAQIMQFYHRGHAFGSGSVSIAGGSQIAGFDYDEENGTFTWPLQAGRPFSIAIPGKDFQAYAESVTVTISVQGTTVVGSTEVQYSRGLYGEDEDRFRHSLIPLRPAPKYGSKFGTSNASTVTAAEDPFADCTQGKPSDDPLFRYDRLVPAGQDPHSLDYKPNWLGEWVLSRCSNPNVNRPFFTSDLFAQQSLSPGGGSPNTPDLKYKDVVWFTAACAYVIEKYWKMVYPDCRIKITSWYRNEPGHGSMKAMDFAVLKRSWVIQWRPASAGMSSSIISGQVGLAKPDWADTTATSSTPNSSGVRTIRIGSSATLADLVPTVSSTLTSIEPLHTTLEYQSPSKIRVYDLSPPGVGTFVSAGGLGGFRLVNASGFYEGTNDIAWATTSSTIRLGSDATGVLLVFDRDNSLVHPIQLWASYKMLSEAGRIPKGGRGLYLNVNPTTGVQGPRPQNAGTASSNLSGPGGSAAPHYDIRGAFGFEGPPTYWAHFDWTADGNDEAEVNSLKVGEQTPKGALLATQADIWLIVADPANELKSKYMRNGRAAGLFTKMYTDTKDVPRNVSRDMFAALGGESTRISVRDNLRGYVNGINSAPTPGAVLVVEPLLPIPDNTVPNARQVLGYEKSCFHELYRTPGSGIVPGTTTTTAAVITNSLDLGKYTYAQLATPSDSRRAPLIEVYGGVNSGGRESGQYMYDYFNPPEILKKNNVFVAKNKDVDGVAATAFVEREAGTLPTKRILIAYSAGGQVIKKFLESKLAYYDKIYLTDVYLGVADYGQFFKRMVLTNPGKFVYIYNLGSTSTAVASAARRALIAIPGLESYKVPSHPSAPTKAMDHLYRSGLINI
jgi:hypothetical protein